MDYLKCNLFAFWAKNRNEFLFCHRYLMPTMLLQIVAAMISFLNLMIMPLSSFYNLEKFTPNNGWCWIPYFFCFSHTHKHIQRSTKWCCFLCIFYQRWFAESNCSFFFCFNSSSSFLWKYLAQNASKLIEFSMQTWWTHSKTSEICLAKHLILYLAHGLSQFGFKFWLESSILSIL